MSNTTTTANEDYIIQVHKPEYTEPHYLHTLRNGGGGFHPMTLEEARDKGGVIAFLTTEQAQRYSNKNSVELDRHPVPPQLRKELEEAYAQPQPQPQQQPVQHPKPKGFWEKATGLWGKEKQPEPQQSQPTVQPKTQSVQPKSGEETKAQRRKRRFDMVAFIVCFALGIGLAIAVTWNIQPFVQFVIILSKGSTFAPFFAWLATWPILGGLITAIGGFGAMVGGFLIYLVCQIIEVAALLMILNHKRLAAMIESQQGWKKFEHHSGDSRVVSRMKNLYNDHPVRSFVWLMWAAFVVYAFELFVTTFTNPWASPNSWAFFYYLCTFQFSKIYWTAFFLTLSVMFLVQGIVGGLVLFFPQIYSESSERKQ